MFLVELLMHIYILLCATAILTVTRSTPIVVTDNEVEDEGITNRKIASDVEKAADFVDVKSPRIKRQELYARTGQGSIETGIKTTL